MKPKSIRLRYFNYKSNGAYFVTICTNYRKLFLKNETIKDIVVTEFTRLKKRFSGINIDILSTMPDHVHFIVWLENSNHSLSEIVQAYKSLTTLAVKRSGLIQGRLWQPNYYEHVIRNEKSLEKIREYIGNNPLEIELLWDELDCCEINSKPDLNFSCRVCSTLKNSLMPSKLGNYIVYAASILLFAVCSLSAAEPSDDGSVKGWFKPKIYIYQPPPVEISTSPVFRTVDPQIIQKLIDLLQENNLGKEEKQDDQDNKSIGELLTYLTPEGRELQDRYTRLGVTLSEALGWEQIKHIRVISEQNLKQRLTTVARWDSSPNVRCIALVSLATLKDQNDLVYFQEALWSRNIGVRYATVEALLKWGYPDAIPLLKNLVEKDESLLIKVVAASALARLGSPEGIVTLRVNINHADWFVRALCAKALGEVGNWEDYDLLVNQINREQNSNTNDFVLAEISISALKLFPQKIEKEKEERELKKKKNVPAPQPEIKKEKPKPRNDVLFELEPLVVTAPRLKIQQGELVDSRVNFQLLKLLQDKAEERITTEMDTQSSAFRDLNALVTPNGIRLKSRYTILGLLLTEGLAGTNDFQLKDALMRIIREDIPLQAENKIVKSFALIALAFCKDLSHLSLFQNALRSESSAERFAAIEALGIWGYREASTILVGVTKLDRSPMIRVYAAQQVLRLGDLMGKDYLITALNDEDWIARAMSMRYLGEMGGAEDYNKILSYFGLQQKDIVQAEMCSALLRLHAKKYESENK